MSSPSAIASHSSILRIYASNHQTATGRKRSFFKTTLAKAGKRYDNFLDVLARRLAKGQKLRREVGEDVSLSSPETKQS